MSKQQITETKIEDLEIYNGSKKLLRKLGCLTFQDALNLEGSKLKEAKVNIREVRNLVHDLAHISIDLFMNSKLKRTIKNDIVSDIIYNEQLRADNKKTGYISGKRKSLLSRILYNQRKLKDEDIVEL